MATYAEVLWTEHEYGKDDGAYYFLNEVRNYVEEDSSRYRRPIVTNIYREAIELYDRHLYEKGACVYHMVRSILGEELFDKAIHIFVNDHAHKTVETIDLLRSIEKATGYNLAALFDQYVFRGGHPDYKIAYSWDGDSNLAQLTITQTQAKNDNNGSKSELFDLKIPITFGYIDNGNISETTLSIRIHQKQQSFYFPLTKKPDYVSFDQGNKFLKTVTLEYPSPELKAQLKYDSDVVSRIHAATALAKKGGIENINILAEALTQDSFWGVRVEVAKKLATIKLEQAATALMAGLQDSDARVRRAVIEGLSEFKTSEAYKTIKRVVKEGDASYYTEAAAVRCLGSMVGGNLKDKQEKVIQRLEKVLEERAGWNETIRSSAIGSLSQMKTSPAAVDIILKYTKASTPQPLRLAAIRALGTVSTGQTLDKVEAILEQLEVISGESFFLTQVAAVVALGQMQTAKALGILGAISNQSPDGRVKRMAEEAIHRRI
jgi:aminopeptidase N